MNLRPTSHIQDQYLVNSALFEASAAYNISELTRVVGEFDGQRFKEAWTRVWGATEILQRTDGVPADLPWAEVTCQETQVVTLASQEANRPFVLDRSQALVRFVVYRCSPVLHFILVVQHHSVTDLFSKNLLAAHLSLAWTDRSFHPELVPYSRFIEAEARWLASEAGLRSRDWWLAKMTGGTETLRLPGSTWKPRPFSGTGGRLPWRARENHSAALLAQEPGGRPAFLVLLTAYAALLARLSGQKKFFVAVPLTNRQGVVDLPLAGPCVNVLPVCVEVVSGETLADLYGRIRGEMLMNHRNQRMPFLEIVRSLPPGDRDPLRPRILQAGFTNEPPMVLRLEGLDCQPVGLQKTGAQMDLFFTWHRTAEGWEGTWEYNDASFSPADVALWQEGFDRMLEEVLFRPGTPVSRVALVDEEPARLLCRGPEVDYPVDRPMGDLLRASYAAHRDKVALVWQGRETSYGDFGDGVARVADYLHRHYGTRGRVVVLVERGPQMLYALHGTVLSGNAYVPIGTDWPVSRIADILEDVQPLAVLTQREFWDKFSGAPCPVLVVDDLVAAPPAPFPGVTVSPEDILYILYTSGTTGRPKGVPLPHRAIVNHVLWMQSRYRLGADERCLLKIPYTFDVSVWELFWPFAAGAGLIIAEETLHKDPRELLELAVRERATRLDFVPSLLDLFLDVDGLSRLTSLTDVQCIGEALPVNLLEKFLKRLPGVRLHNLYGPTEAAVSVTHWECGPDDLVRGTVPLGRPMDNVQIYVVDRDGQLCPRLVKGEILLGGTCLALGYWRRDDLTAERFVANPFGPGRLYRTGDWGRWGLDGALEYLERQDSQTKIRGVRLELGEIESFLRQIPAVENAVVKKGKGPTGLECLIAYYTLKAGGTASPAQLRAELARNLPAPVVPDHFIALSTFPMNENGKLDRKALADVVTQGTVTAAALPSHLSPDLEQVVRLWEQALGVPCHDIAVNFFDAGGNSLSLLELRRLLETSFGVLVKVADLFQYPTVSGMASLVRPQATGPSVPDTGLAERARLRQQALRGQAVRNRDKR